MTRFRPIADRYEAFLLDLDGVVYRGDEAVSGAPETLAALRERDRRVVFLTNNSARPPDAVAERLEAMGIPASPEEVVTSAQAAGTLLTREARNGATAYVVGEEGIRRALADAGIEVLDGSPDRADLVVVGWDRQADYERLRTASVLVQRGARLVATNTDASYPAPGGELWPGAGALVAAIETATGTDAVVAGKPERPLFQTALERAGTTDALVVGDRAETDVAGAVAAGLDAAVVFSGAVGPRDLLDHDAAAVAAFEDLSGLLEPHPAVRVRPAEDRDGDAVSGLLEEAGLQPAYGGMLVAEDDDVLATASVEVRGAEAYLSSVAVREDARGLHVGILVAAGAVRRAASEGAKRCMLLTEGAATFFGRLGFEAVERASLPPWMSERARTCPETAVAMDRRI